MKLGLQDSQHTTRTNQACAACRHQRKKCPKDCIFAPYFRTGRAGENEDFKNVVRLFGVVNVSKLMIKVGVENRDETMRSVIYEANARKAYPVEGCSGIIVHLMNQIRAAEAELDIVTQQVRDFRAFLSGQNRF